MKTTMKIAVIAMMGMCLGVRGQINDTGDKVGVGISNPNAKLEIRGENSVYSDFNDYSGISQNSFLPNQKEPTLVISESISGKLIPAKGGQTTYKGGLSFGRGGSGIYSVNPNPAGSSYYGDIRFHTTSWNGAYYNADRMVIKGSNGNVGIGTTSPRVRLDISDNKEDYVSVIENSGVGTSKNTLWLKTKSSWTSSIPLKITKGTDDRAIFQVGANQIRIGDGTIKQSDETFLLKGNFRLGKGGTYDDLVFKTGSTFTGTNGVFEIVPKTMPGSGIAKQTTYFKNAEHSSGKTIHNVVVDGKVGIGTTNTRDFELGVNGRIAANEVKVAIYPNWPDFVFKKSHNLPTLKEVENHINEKGHLKDIPSAKEVEKNGFFLGEMDAKLLQKIEELTLYTITQEKEIKKEKAENKKQQKEIDELKALVQKLLKDKN